MVRAFLYDAEGSDQEVALEKAVFAGLNERRILWIDVEGRDLDDLRRVGSLVQLTADSVRALLPPGPRSYLDNYGEYVQFELGAIVADPADEGHRAGLAKQRAVKLDFVLGLRWNLTAHEEPLAFLQAFREQDKGETLIGRLEPASARHLASRLASDEPVSRRSRRSRPRSTGSTSPCWRGRRIRRSWTAWSRCDGASR